MEEAISDAVTLAPGHVTLDAWQRIYRGATCRLSATCRDAVEAAAETVERIVARGKAVYGINTGFGKLATTRIEDAKLSELQRNLVLSHATGTGEALPADVVGLVMALKLTSLGRGASGVAWSTVEMLAAMLERGLHPVIPAQGSVGASGDLAPLAHLAAAMTGVGEINLDGRTLPAADALNRVGLEPLQLRPKEGLALLNGTQVSTALALAGLFEIARVFETALITGSMALDAALGSDVPFDARIHALRPHRGQGDVAAAFRALIADSEIRASHKDCGKVQDPYSLRCQPQVMGACLDLIRHAVIDSWPVSASVIDQSSSS